MSGLKKHVVLAVAAGALLALPLWGCGGGGGDGVKSGAEAEGESAPEGGDGGPEPGGDGTGSSDDDIGTGDTGDTGVTEPTDGDTPAAQLSIVGEYQRAPVGDAAGTVTAEFHRWGVWGGIPREDAAACTAIGCPPPGDTIFLAYLDQDAGGAVTLRVNGIRSRTSPQAGSAVWSGEVLGYASADVAVAEGASVTAYAAVRGDARLAADFETDTVAVEFTEFDDGRSDLSWDGLAVEAGAFGDGDGSIEGSFYGTDHEGAAGTFARGGLAGVFGMLRASPADPGDGDTSGPDEPSWPVEPGEPGTGATAGVTIAWGDRLPGSDLSPVIGAEDDFGPGVVDALLRAAGTVPNGASQSSWGENGRTSDEISVHVVRDDDGNLVHMVTDEARIAVPVPFGLPRQGFGVALFTDLIPGIEPDLSSYPHEVLGIWASDDEAAAFWGMSPSIPEVSFSSGSPTGTATYEGDAVGLHASGGTVTKFLADVEMVADFAAHTVEGTVDGFRSFAGESLGALTVTLGETGFSTEGDPFSGETSSTSGTVDVAGTGQWGGRWSDGEGWTMGGTFGFAADDASVGVLGAFTAASGASGDGGNPDDPVSTSR